MLDLRRRQFITLLGGAAAVWPLTARAQQAPRAARLGYLAPASNPDLQQALLGGLRDLGYVEGQNLAIEYRFMLGQAKSYDELAAELAGTCSRRHRRRRHATGARGETANYHHSHYHGTRRRSPAQRPCRKPFSSWGQRD